MHLGWQRNREGLMEIWRNKEFIWSQANKSMKH